MPIVDVKRDWEGSTAESFADGVLERQENTEVWTVLFDGKGNPLLRSTLARDAAGIPVMWEAHPSNPWVYVSSKNARPKGGPLLYEVTVNYSYEPDPLEQPPEISWTFSDVREPIEKDVEGYAIVNSSWEPLDPPVYKDFHDKVLRIVRNEITFDQARADKYKGSVNKDMFFGFAPGKVKCVVYDGVKTRVAHLTYWRVTYEFHIRRNLDDEGVDKGWKVVRQDRGYRVKNAAGDFVEYKDTEGNRPSQPIYLDGEGNKLPEQGTLYTTKIKTFTFPIYEQEPFSVLGLA